MAAYSVAGPGVTRPQIYDDLQSAIDAADEVNQATAGTDAALYGAAFVIPAMAIKYPAAIAPTTPSSSSTSGGLGASVDTH